MSQIYHTRVVSKRKMNDNDDEQYKSFQRQQEMLNKQMFKMQEIEQRMKVSEENVEKVSENVGKVSENIEKVSSEKVVEKVENVSESQNPSDDLSIIREDLESYKKQTDGRIEKLVNLFLSIDK